MNTAVVAAGLVVLAAAACASDDAGARAGAEHRQAHAAAIPGSIQAEHAAIHAALEHAMTLPGRTGEAARGLAATLHPHFVREEEIALPPLGWLAPLSAGEVPPGTEALLVMTDTLRRELPAMLREHVTIREAVAGLREAALAEGVPAAVDLAEDLALHARTEEEVLYPAAVLVGDLLRLKEE